jgi:ATP-dependent RNA circularization protein (DNA/RNA ligase family)
LKETSDNTFWQVARELDIEAKMREQFGLADYAIQGELIGPGIQGNIYKLSKPEFHVFDVYNIQYGQYLKPALRRAVVKLMGLTHVPVIWSTWKLSEVDSILAQAEGRAWLNKDQEREGIVFKQVDGGMTFKAISNKYLLGEK